MARIRKPWREAGFTYLGLIILVTIIGLVGAAALKVDALMRRVAAEQELLETGAAFSAALRSYAAATPRGQPRQPPSLKELLRDPRFPGVRRHLRKIFVDPMTGTTNWGVVYLADHKGVLAVYSLSKAKPLKVGNFDTRFPGFEHKEHISDWKFSAAGQQPLRQPLQQPLPGGAPGQPVIPVINVPSGAPPDTPTQPGTPGDPATAPPVDPDPPD